MIQNGTVLRNIAEIGSWVRVRVSVQRMPSWDRLSFKLVYFLKRINGDIEHQEVEMANFVGNIEQFETMEIILIGEKLRYVTHIIIINNIQEVVKHIGGI